ncbi:MAG TPA: acetylxylan esterase [Gemmataceae bacterium]|nr:acetylxylan esterase [Gemmataceae bacterium]
MPATRLAALLAVLLLTSPLPAQEDLTALPGDKNAPPRKMLARYLLAETQKHFDVRRQAVDTLKTPQDVERRQQELKQRFIQALGGFPAKTPLNARVVGVEKRDGYRVERVIYESRPDHHVTANLYLPEGKGPFPGVLMPIGHSNNGKAASYAQRGSILLAKNGLAVLAYDPIGQGERRQLLDATGKPAIPSSTNEHTLIGVGALLVGSNTATYRIWDGIRSLDYLASRPEIDSKRLGCTGSSGGGTLTSYLMALDERILAAAPSCYITSLERLFATIGPQDAEQNVTGQVALGIEHADYLTMRAPRPTLLCAATRDFFDIQGTWTTFREATRLYGVLGHPERVALVEFDTQHGYPKPQRESVARWMRRWLLEKDDAVVEGDFPIPKDQDLQCTRSGQVLEDFKGRSAFHLTARRAEELARERAKAGRSQAELLREVRRLLAVPERIPGASVREVGQVQRPGYQIRKVVFETEPGVQVPALWFTPGAPPVKKALTLYVHGDGKAAEAGPGGALERLVKAGEEVIALDLRGLGETAPSPPPKKPGYFGTDFKETYLALHLNRPLLGQRTYDLLAVVGYLTGDKATEGRPLHVVGVGTAGPIVLHAAALDPRLKAVTLERSLISWSAVARTPITLNQLTNVVPGALAVYDLPDLAAAVAPRPLTIRAGASPRQEPVTRAALEDAYVPCRQAYQRQKATDRLSLETTP